MGEWGYGSEENDATMDEVDAYLKALGYGEIRHEKIDRLSEAERNDVEC